MAADPIEPPQRWARRRGRLALRLPWRRMNTIPAERLLNRARHDPENAAYFDAQASPSEHRLLRSDRRPPQPKGNGIPAALRARMQQALRADREADPSNSLHAIADLARAYPLIDKKDSADWEAVTPNKEVLPHYVPNEETRRRLRFARYLVERGTYNEGFADDTAPPQYRPLDFYDDTAPSPPHEDDRD